MPNVHALRTETLDALIDAQDRDQPTDDIEARLKLIEQRIELVEDIRSLADLLEQHTELPVTWVSALSGNYSWTSTLGRDPKAILEALGDDAAVTADRNEANITRSIGQVDYRASFDVRLLYRPMIDEEEQVTHQLRPEYQALIGDRS